jgi:N-acetylglucosaminyl-diphospho-decaprenol L-rhamnosyltransferase
LGTPFAAPRGSLMRHPLEGTLAVVVVAYRSSSTIARCLSSLRHHCAKATIIVVDNSACLVTKSIVATYGRVDYVAPGDNIGYARAVNLGAERTLAEYLLVLNPDVTLTAGIDDVLELLQRFDLVAGLLPNSDGWVGERVPNARPAVSLSREYLRGLIGTRSYRSPEINRASTWTEVDQVDGAFMLMRRSWYDAGPLDQRFELYYEDVALCARARLDRGCAVLNKVIGVHEGGVSAGNSGGLAFTAHRVSRARYLRLQYPHWPSIALWPPFVLEVVSRTLTWAPEPLRLRLRSAWRAWRELRTPNSQWVLREAGA